MFAQVSLHLVQDPAQEMVPLTHRVELPTLTTQLGKAVVGMLTGQPTLYDPLLRHPS